MMPVITVSAIGLVLGVILVIAAKLMAVPVNQTAEDVRAVLPGANCGACGFAGCDDYAKKLAEDPNTKTNLCIPGGEPVARQISEILGVEFAGVQDVKAVVRCAATFDTAEYKMDYKGPQTCKACSTFYKGHRSCSYGCLGFGDCVDVCKFGALSIENGLAVVDRDLCTGCGACAKACPQLLIALVKSDSLVQVCCSSHDKGAQVRKVCSAGCIGCMRCQKTCEFGAITVKDNLASIDPDKCTNCGKCAEVCPTKVIHIAGVNGGCAGCASAQ